MASRRQTIRSSGRRNRFKRRTDVAPRLPMATRSSSFSFIDLTRDPLIDIEYTSTPPQTYTLEEVCKIDIEPQSTVNSYVCKWLSEYFVDELEKCTLKTEWDGLDMLEPFCVSSSMRIDVAAVLTENGIPILLIEIHSNQYDNTVAHCMIGLIFQLRFVRLFDQTIDTVSGFVLPKKKVKERISLITVEWKNFCYHINWQYLKDSQLIDKISYVLRTQSEFSKFQTEAAKDYFMGLSQSDLTFLQNSVIKTEHRLIQIESAFAILVSDEKYFYKYCFDAYSNLVLKDLVWLKSKSPLSSPHLVLPNDILYTDRRIPIFKFDAQPHQPLTREEASRCLVDFVNQAIESLNELHTIGYAHCDVRLPNFCFSKNFEVMLIDFDRAVSKSYRSIDSRENFFLKLPSKVRNSQGLDMKQLGLMIHIITHPELDEDSLREEIVSSDLFVRGLITDGILDLDLWKDSQLKNGSMEFCKDVLLDRIPSP